MPRQNKQEPGLSPTEISAELSFEQAYAELEKIVEQLEQGDLPLEQSLALHARGQKLATHCGVKLEQAELQVRVLSDKLTQDEPAQIDD